MIEEEEGEVTEEELNRMFPVFEFMEEEGSCDMAVGSRDMETGPATGSCDIEGEGKDHEPVAGISVVGFTSEELQSIASLHMSLYNRGSCVSDGSVIAQSAKSSYDLASSLARSIDAVPGKFGVFCFAGWLSGCKLQSVCKLHTTQ